MQADAAAAQHCRWGLASLELQNKLLLLLLQQVQVKAAAADAIEAVKNVGCH